MVLMQGHFDVGAPEVKATQDYQRYCRVSDGSDLVVQIGQVDYSLIRHGTGQANKPIGQ
jgi:hypothetical protein